MAEVGSNLVREWRGAGYLLEQEWAVLLLSLALVEASNDVTITRAGARAIAP